MVSAGGRKRRFVAKQVLISALLMLSGPDYSITADTGAEVTF